MNKGFAPLAVIAVVALVALFGLGSLSSADGQTAGVWNSVQKLFGTGSGAPSGSHYNLNIIGVANPKTDNMSDGGNVIFVPLNGKTTINLFEAPEGESYYVKDKNGTDGSASFQLPVADTEVDVCTTNADGTVTCGSGVTVYSVFVKALGGKQGTASMTLCGTADGEEVCSSSSLELTSGGKKFTNVTADLLYLYGVWLDTNADGIMDTYYKRIPLFSSVLEGYFWDYDNQGRRLVQMRFYECSTTVGEDSATIVSSTCELTGR